MENNLIFDLGFHKGEDTENYLSKGFKVVAVEANKILYGEGLFKFKDEIKNGNLILLNKAVYGTSDDILPFFINPNVTEWGSIRKNIAEQNGVDSYEQEISTITFTDLCKYYGVPYYCKVDIESADTFVVMSLSYYRPQYISFELNQTDYITIFSHLHLSGYKKFQLRNQGNNKNSSSGEFGIFLPKDKWISIEEALSRYNKFKELRNLDKENLSFGWLDIHAVRD